MKKLFSLTLCILLSCSALAEKEWVTYKLGGMSYALPASYALESEDLGEVSYRMEINDDDARYEITCLDLIDESVYIFPYEEWIDAMKQLAEMYNDNFIWEYCDIAGYQGVVCSSDFGTIKENAFYCIVEGKAYEVIDSASSPTIERLDFKEFLKTIEFEIEE